MKVFKAAEKKKILKMNKFGIDKLDYLFLKFGKEKIRIYSGNLSREELMILDKELRVESVGLYFGVEQNDEIRLGFDAVSLLKDEISDNILDIDDEQTVCWMRGEDIEKSVDNGFVILRNKEMLIGCGRSNGEKILNYVPKERRVLG